jgi:hypothetical protein
MRTPKQKLLDVYPLTTSTSRPPETTSLPATTRPTPFTIQPSIPRQTYSYARRTRRPQPPHSSYRPWAPTNCATRRFKISCLRATRAPSHRNSHLAQRRRDCQSRNEILDRACGGWGAALDHPLISTSLQAENDAVHILDYKPMRAPSAYLASNFSTSSAPGSTTKNTTSSSPHPFRQALKKSPVRTRRGVSRQVATEHDKARGRDVSLSCAFHSETARRIPRGSHLSICGVFRRSPKVLTKRTWQR